VEKSAKKKHLGSRARVEVEEERKKITGQNKTLRNFRDLFGEDTSR